MTEHNLANDLSNTDYTYSTDVMTGGSDRRMYLFCKSPVCKLVNYLNKAKMNIV